MGTSEFQHYDGCRGDVDNCQACALTDTRQERPNYAAWPLAYMVNGRTIPAVWKAAFFDECARTDNPAYTANIVKHVIEHGAWFSDGTCAKIANGLVVHGNGREVAVGEHEPTIPRASGFW
jgi:hypothetical protein